MNSNKIVTANFKNRNRQRDECSRRGEEADSLECSTLSASSRRRLRSKTTLFLVLLFASASCFASEKSSSKDKQPSLHYLGWIGGEFSLARRHWSWADTTDAVIAFPEALTNTQKGVLITALATNTPAYLAGLRESDLILELDPEKIATLAAFGKK